MHHNIKHTFLQIIPNLPDTSWEAFEEKLVTKHYKKGEIISEMGKVNNFISFIKKGSVIPFNYIDGKKNIYNFFFENEFTSDYESFLTRRPAKYGLEAIENSTLIDIHYNDLQKIYTEHPVFERVGRLMAEAQFVRVSVQTMSLLTENPRQRYIRLIKEKPQVIRRVPQYLIAAYLGIAPETLSRVRKNLFQG